MSVIVARWWWQDSSELNCATSRTWDITDHLLSAAQALIMLAVGAARQSGGFRLVLWLLSAVMVLNLLVTRIAMRASHLAITVLREQGRPLAPALDDSSGSLSDDDVGLGSLCGAPQACRDARSSVCGAPQPYRYVRLLAARAHAFSGCCQ